MYLLAISAQIYMHTYVMHTHMHTQTSIYSATIFPRISKHIWRLLGGGPRVEHKGRFYWILLHLGHLVAIPIQSLPRSALQQKLHLTWWTISCKHW